MKFQPRSEKTRQFIIEKTATLFNKKGYAGTSLSDLTEATKLTKGSIYGNFENKEEVAAAVLEYNLLKRQTAIGEKVEAANTWKDKLMVYATAYSSKFASFASEGGCPYLNGGTDADDTNELLRKKVASGLERWQQSIMHIIDQGISAGEFKPNINIPKMAISMIALIEGGIFLSSVMKNQMYLDNASETATELIAAICN